MMKFRYIGEGTPVEAIGEYIKTLEKTCLGRIRAEVEGDATVYKWGRSGKRIVIIQDDNTVYCPDAAFGIRFLMGDRSFEEIED